MGVIYAGIDEAGYGPMLGPLCVGFCALRLDADPAAPTPDVLTLLGDAVCRDLKTWRARAGRPIAIGDSKRLKLSNTSKTRHPLFHLERGVLSLLHAAGDQVQTDERLFAVLGADLLAAEGDAGGCNEPIPLPLGDSASSIAIAANVLASAMDQAGIELAALASETIGVRAFNDIVARTGTKASATASGIAKHLRTARALWGQDDVAVRLVCDRLGGRSQYAGVLRRALGDDGREVVVTIIEESEGRSRYRLAGDGLGSDWQIMFLTEGEDAHAPVAWASMTAKLTRELAMARFNRYWTQRAIAQHIELKPTAGYVQDARRWLIDCEPLFRQGERASLVRRA